MISHHIDTISDFASPETGLEAELDQLQRRLEQGRRFNIGFPGATDFDYTPLATFLTRELLNNVGDPYVDGVGRNQTKALERQVISFCADLFRAPAQDRWGYVTTGGSESNLYALQLARSLLPRAVVYFSDAAHYSIDKAIGLLSMEAVRVRTDQHGEVDYRDLHAQISQRRHRPAIVAATVGTTMSEAIDDVRRIADILDDLAVRDRFIHADAALAGIPLGLMHPDERPGFDFLDGADSIAVSGHKFLGSPTPCGVLVTKASHRSRVARGVGYTASPDATISGSRSGHAPLMLWYAINYHGIAGLQKRAELARTLAAHAYRGLQEIGWPSYRHEHAFTVVMRTPPESVLRTWVLATADGWSHLITMPGITEDIVNRFTADMATAVAASSNPPTIKQGNR